MLKKLRDVRGGAVMMLALGGVLATSIYLGWMLRGVSAQKNLQRKLSVDKDYNKLMEQVTNVILNDLRYAAKYPDAVFLQDFRFPEVAKKNETFRIDAPKSPIFAKSTIPCGTRDPDDSCRYTLDAYLVPGDKNCNAIHPGKYINPATKSEYFTKKFFYPLLTDNDLDHLKIKGNDVPLDPNFPQVRTSKNVLIQPVSNPEVEVSKVYDSVTKKFIPELYSLIITFEVCDPRYFKSNQTTAIACVPKERIPVRYEGVINTNTEFFQQCPACPRLASGACNPATGKFGCPACDATGKIIIPP